MSLSRLVPIGTCVAVNWASSIWLLQYCCSSASALMSPFSHKKSRYCKFITNFPQKALASLPGKIYFLNSWLMSSETSCMQTSSVAETSNVFRSIWLANASQHSRYACLQSAVSLLTLCSCVDCATGKMLVPDSAVMLSLASLN